MMSAVLSRRPERVAAVMAERRPPAHASGDADLVAAVITNEAGAVGRLYERFSSFINHVVLRVLGGDADHDDLVHEAFLAVWRSIARGHVQKVDSLQAYVASVTTNVVYKELRKRYVRRRLLGRDEEAPEMTSRIHDDEAREVLTLVYAIAAELPPQERLLFSLRHLGQYKLAEVASLAECSLSTVKRKLAKAEAAFLRRAQDYPEHPRLMELIDAGGDP